MSDGGTPLPGITLNISTGELSGLCNTAGIYAFTVRFRDECAPVQEVTREVEVDVF